MKRLLLPVAAAAALAGGCASNPYRVRTEPSPIGRWDRVAALAAIGLLKGRTPRVWQFAAAVVRAGLR